MKTSSIEKVKELYENSADSYNTMMDTEIDLPIYADALGLLAGRIKEISGAVVDTSCGSGHMLNLYHERYDPQRPLIGLDLSQGMVAKTKEKLGSFAEIFSADMRDLSSIPQESSAAVISYFALHHLTPPDILTALKEWHRVLCQQGQLIIAIWEGTGSIDYGDETDVVALRYTEEEITALVLKSGFTIQRSVVEPVEEIPMEAVYLEATKV